MSTSTSVFEALKEGDVSMLIKSLIELMPLEEYDNSESDRLEFLKEMLQKSAQAVNKSLIDLQKAEAVATMTAANGTNLDGAANESILVLADALFVEPRGRFKTTLSLSGMMLEGKQFTAFVPWTLVANAACIPSNVSTKKEGEDLLALSLGENSVKIGGKESSCFLMSLGKNAAKPLEVTAKFPASASPSTTSTSTPSSSTSSEIIKIELVTRSFSGTESAVITQLLPFLIHSSVDFPRKDLFLSSTSKPYVRCYKGIQEGAIYPLKSGL